MSPENKSTFLYSFGLALLGLSLAFIFESKDAGIGGLVLLPLSIFFFFSALILFAFGQHYSKKIIKDQNGVSDLTNPRKERTRRVLTIGVLLLPISYFMQSKVSMYVGVMLIIISAYQYAVIKYRKG